MAMPQIEVTHPEHPPNMADLLIPIGRVRAVATVWQALTKWLFDDYKPEKHYMRGPGPKWHQKRRFPIMNVANRPRDHLAAWNAAEPISIP
jgi:hypothetical protein